MFRDREELPTSCALSDNIDVAMESSRYLIVICSPQSASSLWVNEEIKIFNAKFGEQRVLCLIVDGGRGNASDKPKLNAKECLPEAIRYRVGTDRELTNERAEPIAADARNHGDGHELAFERFGEVLDHARSGIAKLPSNKQNRIDLGVVLDSLADLHQLQGERAEALAVMGEVLPLGQALVAQFPGDFLRK